MPPEIDNLTETLQRSLGVQQAQHVSIENVAADAIGHLFQQRGDVSRLAALWHDGTHDEVDGWASHADELDAALRTLRSAIERGLVTRRRGRIGAPSAFVPLSPMLVTRQDNRTIFRNAGVNVIAGLWRDVPLKERLKERIAGWERRHPVARVLVPLCPPHTPGPDKTASHLDLAAQRSPPLRTWLETKVLEDWHAWLDATEALSIDEQLEHMVALVGLHLHVAILWRLLPEGTAVKAPVIFANADRQLRVHDRDRASRDVFNWWNDRVHLALRAEAANAIDGLARKDPYYGEKLRQGRWEELSTWSNPTISHSKNASEAWKRTLREMIEQRVSAGTTPTPQEAHEFLVDVLVRTFSRGSSHVVSKMRDYLRSTGTAAGIIGPEALLHRKRYRLGDRALELLVRLHVARPERLIATRREESQSIDAFLDDVFDRYGLLVSAEGETARQALHAMQEDPTWRVLRKRLPSDEAMRVNRADLEQRLEELRLVRRYSDASAVVRVH